MVDRINDLHTNHHNLSDSEVRAMLEAWDRDQGRAMRHSERICGNPTQRNYWSPALRNAGLLCRYWNIRFKEASTPTSNYTNTIQRLLRSAQQHSPSFQFPLANNTMSVPEILENWKLAKQALREAQVTSKELRFRSYSDLLSHYEDDNDPSTRPESLRRAKIIKNTMRTEDIRATFRKIKSASTPWNTYQGGLCSVMIPVTPEHDNQPNPPDTTQCYQLIHSSPPIDYQWQTIIDRNDIKHHLLKYNCESLSVPLRYPRVAMALSWTL
jgi:hypothetical protein